MVREMCARYLAAVERRDLEAVLALFTDDGIVVSPLYGEAPARDFFSAFLTDTDGAQLELVDVYEASDPRRFALHLRSRWTLSGGFVTNLDAVDLVELAPDQDRFSRMVVVYDSAQVRGRFEGMKSAWGPGSPIEQSARARTLAQLFDPPE